MEVAADSTGQPWALLSHDGASQLTSDVEDAEGWTTLLLPAEHELATTCDLCSQFLRDWHSDNFGTHYRDDEQKSVIEKLGGRWKSPPGSSSRLRFRHHESLADLVESALSGCSVCCLFMFGVANWKARRDDDSGIGSVPWDQLLHRRTRLRVNPSNVPLSNTETFEIRPGPDACFTLSMVLYLPKTDPDYEYNQLFKPFRNTPTYGTVSLDITVRRKQWDARLLGQPKKHSPRLALPSRDSMAAIAASAREMLRTCHETHSRCSGGPNGFLPKRLIEVGRLPGSPARLVNTHGLKKEKYAALSYCWGGANKSQLMKSNLDVYLDAIHVETLPSTLRDVILFTREIGIGYIWIDALCIVQDDLKDWEAEALQMRDVYQSAHLCISALRAPDSASPLFPSDDSWNGMDFILADGDKEHKFALQRHGRGSNPLGGLHGALEQARLTSRGWALQERFLSQKILHIGPDEVFFECRQQVMGESGFVFEPWGNNLVLRDFYNILNGASKREAIYLWYAMIREYASRNFTQKTDRLAAFEGMRQLFQPVVKSPYLYGLWLDDIYTGLLWFRVTGVAGGWAATLSNIGAGYHPGWISDSSKMNHLVFGEPEFSAKGSISCLPLHLGLNATWCWASSLPADITFVVRDNGTRQKSTSTYSGRDEQPRAPTNLKFSVLDISHLELSSRVQPTLTIKGFLVEFTRDNRDQSTKISIHFKSGPTDLLLDNFESGPMSGRDKCDVFLDSETEEPMMNCSALLACQAEFPYMLYRTKDWKMSCTLTLLLLRNISLDAGVRDVGLDPSRTFERIGIAFLQSSDLFSFIEKRVAERGDTIYLM